MQCFFLLHAELFLITCSAFLEACRSFLPKMPEEAFPNTQTLRIFIDKHVAEHRFRIISSQIKIRTLRPISVVGFNGFDCSRERNDPNWKWKQDTNLADYNAYGVQPVCASGYIEQIGL